MHKLKTALFLLFVLQAEVKTISAELASGEKVLPIMDYKRIKRSKRQHASTIPARPVLLE